MKYFMTGIGLDLLCAETKRMKKALNIMRNNIDDANCNDKAFRKYVNAAKAFERASTRNELWIKLFHLN